MSWFSGLFTFLKGDISGEWKALTQEIKAAKDEFKKEANERKAESDELRDRVKHLEKELRLQGEEMLRQYEREEKCLRQQARIMEGYRDLREWIIFKLKGKVIDGNNDTMPNLDF